VVFNPPTDDGGDAVSGYVVEWSRTANFTDASGSLVTYLNGGAPFYKTISPLEPGVHYYVRVSAQNSQGLGPAARTTPSNLNPRQEPGPPADVRLLVTSDTMLTVAFEMPLDSGGDDVTHFVVEWDTGANFNTLSAYPDKGSVQVRAAEHRSATLTSLTPRRTYYVRVLAVNGAGRGAPQTASPKSRSPGKRVPGKPLGMQVGPGADAGSLDVSWQRPRIPHHDVPCSGTLDLPDDCPVLFGGSLPQSTGGDDVAEYEVQFNEHSNFMGQDGGFVTTKGMTLNIAGLTAGRSYFARVLARNSVGSGEYCATSGEVFPRSY